MDCNVTWSAPWWDENYSRKHRKPSRRARQMWDRSILAANTDGDDAIYDPNLTAAEIQAIEMECVQDAVDDTADDENEIGELQLSICHVRRFYKKLDAIVGASDGTKTAFVLVQYESNGSVHGFPVTEAYLKSQGADL